MNELAERARSLHCQIRETLLNEWDPIGVHDMNEAQDEYDGYIPTIYSFLIARKTSNEVLDYLLWLENEHMGLKADRQRTQHVAEKLLHLV